ncbi:MAG: 2-oxo acid dehydrogenase subunit E2 [Clostridiales bacterium]|nr:2-oxo acid dehydrogenase subunit E2 [Clostridiales bacterium]
MVKKVVMPSAGQTTDVATVTRICVSKGDAVRKGDVLMEVETDKAVLPIESFARGFVTEIYVSEFDKVDAGTPLLAIGDAADMDKPDEKTAEASAAPAPEEDDFVPVMPSAENASANDAQNVGASRTVGSPAMPNAKKLAAELGVSLDSVSPSNGSFIKAADVRAAAEELKKSAPAPTAESAATDADTIPTGRMRDSLARRWERSAAVPVFGITVSADYETAGMLCGAASATPAQLVMLALARLASRYPLLRAVYSDGTLKLSDTAAAGLAVSGDNGTVSAAVRDADRIGLSALSAACEKNAAAIAGGDLSSADGAAFTVFDAVPYGVDGFTPPLRIPETSAYGVALADGRLTVSAVFDVRVWEPRSGASLMKDLRERLEAPALLLI